MRKFFIWIGKAVIAGAIAIGVLSVFCLFYYSHGIRKTSTTGATDYTWENKWWSLGYEGYAWGSIDDDGYNNPNILSKGEIDILLMGSSHMNANNVSSGYSTGYLLGSLMKESELKYTVYNIGMEGHDFFICSDNLDEALDTYAPNKYVIMETRFSRLPIDSMEEVLNGTRERTPAFDSGLIYYLQKVPYFRLLHRQIRDIGLMNDTNLLVNSNTEIKEEILKTDSIDELEDNLYEKILDKYMAKLSDEANRKGVTLITFYMPDISIHADGSISTEGTKEDLQLLSKSCNSHNIVFVDLSDVFLQHYEETYELPFGFSNTAIGTGHLNRIGHKLVSDKLFETILKIEDR